MSDVRYNGRGFALVAVDVNGDRTHGDIHGALQSDGPGGQRLDAGEAHVALSNAQ